MCLAPLEIKLAIVKVLWIFEINKLPQMNPATFFVSNLALENLT